MGKLESVTTLIQVVLASCVFYLTLGFLTEKCYLSILEILLVLLTIMFAINNKLFYKEKYITPLCIIFSIMLIIGVLV